MFKPFFVDAITEVFISLGSPEDVYMGCIIHTHYQKLGTQLLTVK